MADTFNSAQVLATTVRTALYGPIATNTVAIVFSGTLANIDSTNRTVHKVTLEKRLADGTTYVKMFNDVPVEYGGASKIPKIVLKTSETLFVTADALNSIQCVISTLERT